LQYSIKSRDVWKLLVFMLMLALSQGCKELRTKKRPDLGKTQKLRPMSDKEVSELSNKIAMVTLNFGGEPLEAEDKLSLEFFVIQSSNPVETFSWNQVQMASIDSRCPRGDTSFDPNQFSSITICLEIIDALDLFEVKATTRSGKLLISQKIEVLKETAQYVALTVDFDAGR